MPNNPAFDNKGFFKKNQFQKTEKQPGFVGKIQIGGDLLNSLCDLLERGEEVALELSGWASSNTKGVINLKAQLPYVKTEESQKMAASRMQRRDERDNQEMDRSYQKVEARRADGVKSFTEPGNDRYARKTATASKPFVQEDDDPFASGNPPWDD